MTLADLLELNLTEVRRRSLVVWQAIPDDKLGWKPDSDAMGFGETIRHVWESTANYVAYARAGRSVEISIPNSEQPIETVQQEIDYAQDSFQAMLEFVRTLSSADLERLVDRSDVGYTRKLGDFLLRVAYHEAVHTGQLLQAMRTAELPRPDIWD